MLRSAFSTFLIVHILTPAYADDSGSAAAGHAFVQDRTKRLEGILGGSAEISAEAVAGLLGEVFDFERLTEITFRDYCRKTLEAYGNFMDSAEQDRLIRVHQERLVKTFRKRILTDLTAYLRTADLEQLQIEDSRISSKKGRIDVVGSDSDGGLTFRCYLRRKDDKWHLEDLAIDGVRISATYRRQFEDILDDKLSLPVLEAHLEEREYVILEDFSTTPSGSLPQGWGWRSKDRKKTKGYTVLHLQGEKPYLAASDSGASVILLKSSRWNPREYPILTWCWRADAIPPGADERFTHTNDSVAGIYVIFSRTWIGVPIQIKYVWSSTLPVGTIDRRKRWARPWFKVVQSGSEEIGKWVFEEVDTYEDYRRIFDGKPKSRSIGLGILTDANSTDSYAEAGYADLRVWTRKARDMGLIENYCGCLDESVNTTATE